MCVCSQLYPFTESYGWKFICWQLIVRVPGRSLQYLHKVFHCELWEWESIKTPEIHRAGCIKLILLLPFRYCNESLPVLSPFQSTATPIKEQKSVCSVQHFYLFITGGWGRKRVEFIAAGGGKSGFVHFTWLSLKPYAQYKCKGTYLQRISAVQLSAGFSWSLTFSNHGFALFYRDLIVPNFLSINGTRCGVALLMLNFNHLSDLIDVNGSFKPKCFRFM